MTMTIEKNANGMRDGHGIFVLTKMCGVMTWIQSKTSFFLCCHLGQ